MSDTTKNIVRARELKRDHVIEIGGLRFQVDCISAIADPVEDLTKLHLHLIATQNTRDLKMTGHDTNTTLIVPSAYTIQLED